MIQPPEHTVIQPQSHTPEPSFLQFFPLPSLPNLVTLSFEAIALPHAPFLTYHPEATLTLPSEPFAIILRKL